MYLYSRPWRVKFDVLNVALLGVIAAVVIAFYNVQIGSNYKPAILAQYCLMVAFVAWYYRRLPVLKSVSVAFLIVYLNSYAWEFPIHVLDFIDNRNLGLQIIQGLHLAPLAFYTYFTGLKWRPKLRNNLEDFILVWIFVLASAYQRIEYPAGLVDGYLMQLNRWAALFVSLKIGRAHV